MVFKFYRGRITISGMEALSVVEDFDVVENGFFGRIAGGVVLMVRFSF